MMGAARLVWLAALALLTAAPARAQPDGLPTEPMLRINAPSHIYPDSAEIRQPPLPRAVEAILLQP